MTHAMTGYPLRDGADVGAHDRGDPVRGAVGLARERPQHGDTLGRDLEAVFLEEVGWIVHSDLL